MLSLVGGTKYVVRESPQQVIASIREHQAIVLCLGSELQHRWQPDIRPVRTPPEPTSLDSHRARSSEEDS